MDNRKNLINKIIVAITMLFIMIIALFCLSEYEVNHGNKPYIDTDKKEIIIMFHRTPNEEELNILFKGYEDVINIEKYLEDFALISIADSRALPSVINYLEDNPLVKSVEENAAIQPMQYTNDTYSSSQWAIHNPGYYSIYSTKGMKEVSSLDNVDMDIPETWILMDQESTNKREVLVAIIDTGVDYTHPDLSENIWINTNEIPGDGIDNDKNGYIDDIFGWDFYNDDASVCHYKYDSYSNLNLSLPEDNDDHGTHIAGVIGAVADNGMGIAGIASNIDIKLMILKINGGIEGTGSIADAILAIKYATRMGADVCNISWGTTQYSSILEQTIKESDMLFVAAAGNVGRDNDIRPIYPASFKLDNLISVTFIDAYGRLSTLSNYGRDSVDIAAPGMDIMSTVVGSYQILSGSSMAAPQVSAVASLLYSYDKNLYPKAVKDIIIKTLKPLPELNNYILYPGMPSAYLAVQEINNVKEDLIPPIINIETIYDKERIIIPVNVVDEGGSGLRVVRWLAGGRAVADFNRGTSGLSLDDNKIRVLKAGEYTIYASDYSGNESSQVYYIEDDTIAPRISSSYTVSENYDSREISIRVIDSKSGIRRVKYLAGSKKASDFLPAGSGIELELSAGKSRFTVKDDGIYTLYAIDNRGNQTVKQIDIKTILSEELKFARNERILKVGEEIYLRAFIRPANSTDVITYTSSDKSIASINNKGKIITYKEGTVSITAQTNNGQMAVCRLVVKR